MARNVNIPPAALPRPRRRWGCFGCIGSTLAIFLVAGLGLLVIDLIFAPWSYKLGGHAHLPYWQGWGSARSAAAGGDFGVYLLLQPAPGSHVFPESHMTGRAWICTPAREMLVMKAGADMPRIPGFDSLGKPVSVYMDNWGGWFPGMSAEHRPYLDFKGHWADRALMLDDQMSISKNFLPDGSVYKNQRPQPKGDQVLNLTLHEGSYWDFKSACAAMKR